MRVLVLFLLIAIGVVLDQVWTRRRIRGYFASLGARVDRLECEPWAALASLRFSRVTSLYRVHYADRSGEGWTARVIATAWTDMAVEDEQPARLGALRDRRSGVSMSPSNSTRSASDWAVFGAACAACALVVFLAIGVPYWSASYRSLQLPDALNGLGLVLVPACSFALTTWKPRRWLVVLASVTAPVVAVIVVRIARDLAADPTSHNLFPFEIALFVGGCASSFGVVAGRLARWFVK